MAEDSAPASVAGTDQAQTQPQDETTANLEARLELLEEENRRLRREYRRVTLARHRRTALALGGLGVVSLVAAAALPAIRDVLVVLGAIGLFGGILTVYLTPERFVSATVSEAVVSTTSENLAAIATELGLSDTVVYVPSGEGTPTEAVRAYIPRDAEAPIPAPDLLEDVFVLGAGDEPRGIAVEPAAARLLAEFELATDVDRSQSRAQLAETLLEALVEQFEVLESWRLDVDEETDSIVATVSGSALGAVDRRDHPVVSLLGAGLARWSDQPIEVTVETVEDGAVIRLGVREWQSGS